MSGIQEVTQWAESMIKSGKYPSSTGRFRISALETLASVLSEDEPGDAQSILSNLDDIALRWATKNMKTGDTTRTYKGRANGLLTDFINWKKDPTSFKGRRAAAPRAPKQVEVSAPTPGPKETSEPETAEVWETVNLGGGRIFKFVSADISVKDAARVAWALAVRATDFDPTGGSPFARSDSSQIQPR